MKKLTTIILFILSFNISAQWKQTNGPYKEYGIHCMSKNGSNLLVGGSFGIFLSSDSGESWVDKSIGIPQFGVLSITSSDSFVYIGTYSGVYFSSDNCSTWQKIDKGFTKPISDIIVADSNLVVTATNGGIYYKSNNMSKWKGASVAPYFYDYISLGRLGKLLFAGTYYGEISISYNNGANWTLVKDRYKNGRINCFFADKENIYAGFDGGVFLSTDKGKNWTIYKYGLTDSTVIALTSLNNKIFAGTYKGVFVSTNNGDTWTKSGLNNSQIISFTDLNNELFACTSDLGISKTLDSGANWVQTSSGLEQYWDVGTITTLDNKLFVGTQRGVFASSNNGSDWKSSFNNPGYLVTSIITYNNYVLAAHSGDYFINFGGLYLSTDKGDSWKQIQSTNYTANTLSYNLLAVQRNRMLVGNSAGIWFSTDVGKTWLPTNYHEPNVDNLSAEVLSFAVSDSLVFAGNRTGVFVSDDFWQTLKQINNGFPYLPWIISLAVSGKDVWAGTWSKGLYHSNNLGDSWHKTDLPILGKVTSIKIIDKMIFVTSDSSGIFFSMDSGFSWKQINSGLKGKNIKCLAVLDNNLFIGVANKGIWTRPLSDITSIEKEKDNIPVKFSLSQNYPNPFNPETTIEYQLPTPGFVTLKVYDLLGREVATLVDEYKSAGTYKVTFDVKTRHGASLQSGVYFYRLTSGSYNETKKLVLLK